MKKRKAGFTLAELLIVVAIIAVLVAISIPIFTSQLEKSREATDLANIRAAYAECSAAVLTETTSNGVTYTAASGSTAAKAVKEVVLKQQVDGWTTTDPNCGGVTLSNDIAAKGKTVVVTVTDSASAPTFTLKTGSGS